MCFEHRLRYCHWGHNWTTRTEQKRIILVILDTVKQIRMSNNLHSGSFITSLELKYIMGFAFYLQTEKLISSCVYEYIYCCSRSNVIQCSSLHCLLFINFYGLHFGLVVVGAVETSTQLEQMVLYNMILLEIKHLASSFGSIMYCWSQSFTGGGRE